MVYNCAYLNYESSYSKFMVKLGLIQTTSHSTNQNGISKVSEMLKKLGKKETEIAC